VSGRPISQCSPAPSAIYRCPMTPRIWEPCSHHISGVSSYHISEHAHPISTCAVVQLGGGLIHSVPPNTSVFRTTDTEDGCGCSVVASPCCMAKVDSLYSPLAACRVVPNFSAAHGFLPSSQTVSVCATVCRPRLCACGASWQPMVLIHVFMYCCCCAFIRVLTPMLGQPQRARRYASV